MPSNENGAATNGNASASRSYPPGIHVPSLTFFDPSNRQELDLTTQSKHLAFLAKSGIHGIVLAGTNGEAMALSRQEKVDLTRLAKKVISEQGKPDLPITVGTSGISTRDVIDDCVAVDGAGADFALILVPSFFHFAMTKDAICEFYEEVADASPLPIMIYNFPNVTAGLNVDSPMLDRLARHRNIVGVKLTCGSIAKVTRVSASFSPKQFSALAGQSDWLVPAMSVGGTGCITGVGNLYPKACVAVYDLYKAGKLEEAQKLQHTVGTAEIGFADGGINGTKWVVSELLGYPEEARHCRRPYPQFTSKDKQKWILETVKLLEADELRLSKTM